MVLFFSVRGEEKCEIDYKKKKKKKKKKNFFSPFGSFLIIFGAYFAGKDD